MRKAQKIQLFNIMQTLREAHKAIRNYIVMGDLEAAFDMLRDCQQSALRTGECIETSEGEACTAVLALADYCEEIYQIVTTLPAGLTAQKVFKQMNKALTSVENCIRVDIPSHFEVVFMPYKAAMWDSLESIWRAAEADPNCDAYVVPIPYYDKNPDGSLGTYHYEGSQYPDYVPVVRYDQYDVENRRPDAIYIHNPYDGDNYVTSVHPDFYASRLRQLTDLLVYIPYIVHSEIIDPVGSTPGVVYSHRVIVQSENIRNQYIQSVLNCVQGSRRDLVREKIVALGSPKADKVLLDRKENYMLPAEWRHLGDLTAAGKRIVLYNVSIGAALEHTRSGAGKRYLDKLRSVFAFFRCHPEIVLWWRPHPLLAQAFLSMRPQLYQEYLGIVEEFKALRSGIYDDTPDSNRAVAYADMCYGDASSLNLLLQLVGKPVLIQNISTAGKECESKTSREQVQAAMEAFIVRNHYNSYILYETSDVSKGGFSLSGFIEHPDVILRYSEEQSAKYRARYVNADGSAGERIYEYSTSIM